MKTLKQICDEAKKAEVCDYLVNKNRMMEEDDYLHYDDNLKLAVSMAEALPAALDLIEKLTMALEDMKPQTGYDDNRDVPYHYCLECGEHASHADNISHDPCCAYEIQKEVLYAVKQFK